MRVAIFANPTISNIQGASDYVEFREACKYITRKYPDAFFYFCLPERARERMTDKLDRVIFLFYDDSNFLWYDGQASAPADFTEMFHTRIGRYPIDAVWTTRTTIGASLGRRLQDHRMPDGCVPVVIEEYKPVDFDENAQTTTETDVVANTLAYMLSWNMFDTHHDFDLAMRAAGRYLTATSAEKIAERSRVIYCGIDFEFIEKCTRETKKNELFTVLFGGRINALKRTDMVFECIDHFYTYGRNVRAVICTPSLPKSQSIQLTAEFPQFEFQWSCPKSEFLQRASSAHAFVNASTNEGFSVGIVEQLYLGLVGVMPDRPWVRGLLMEHFDKYPFIFRDRAEMALKLKWIYENYDDAREALVPIQKMIKERYSREVASIKTWDFIAECVEKQKKGILKRVSRDTGQLFADALMLMPKVFSLDMFCKNVVERSEVMRWNDFENPGRGKPSKWMAYKWLTENGCEDRLDAPVPWFRRKI